MDSSKLIKFALIGGGAYFAYSYLKSSGLWDQWFGPLLGTSVATSVPVPTPAPAQIIPALPTSLQLEQAISKSQGSAASSDEWCYAFAKVTGKNCDANSVAGQTMNATQFLNALAAYYSTGKMQSVGISGLGASQMNPYRWVN